jgi:hypothetical protein
MGFFGVIQPGAELATIFSNHEFVMRYYVNSYFADFVAQKNPYFLKSPGMQGDWCSKTILMGAKTDENL